MNNQKIPFENGDFFCGHCNQWVPFTHSMGTKHRNHCLFCLWSKHVDDQVSGDRASKCQANMKPIGLTFKQEGVDKYGRPRQGEIMIVHECTACDKISINRIAADDNSEAILSILEKSFNLDQNKKAELAQKGIQLIPLEKKDVVTKQLFGIISGN
jgi:hypothetical protein